MNSGFIPPFPLAFKIHQKFEPKKCPEIRATFFHFMHSQRLQYLHSSSHKVGKPFG